MFNTRRSCDVGDRGVLTCGLGLGPLVSPLGPINAKISGPRPVAVRLYYGVVDNKKVQSQHFFITHVLHLCL
jgi:hypothetical protein